MWRTQSIHFEWLARPECQPVPLDVKENESLLVLDRVSVNSGIADAGLNQLVNTAPSGGIVFRWFQEIQQTGARRYRDLVRYLL